MVARHRGVYLFGAEPGEPKEQCRPTPRLVPAAMCIANLTRGTVLCSQAMVARGFRDRSRGLLGHDQLADDEGMVFETMLPMMWMHTFFMAFPIDIVFLDCRNVVIKVQRSLQPGRLSAIVLSARKAIELAAGRAARAQTEVGDFLSISQT
jgi:uncharacterized protein